MTPVSQQTYKQVGKQITNFHSSHLHCTWGGTASNFRLQQKFSDTHRTAVCST